jgi:hypothetical protein|tara:strand:- start:360 stop:542 length:183 start_codon:yes stop_codon:yes gene_type:complete
MGEQVPQQLMNPPAPLMSSSAMPTHPKNDHIMHEADNEENEDIMFNMNDENENIEGLMDS